MNGIKPLLFLLLAGLLFTQMHAAAGADNLIVILDGSGSMWGKLEGKAKIQIAREVLSEIIQALPLNLHVGLVAYGHRTKGDCNDVQFMVPLGPLNKQKILRTLMSIQPRGKTPISTSVEQTVEKIEGVDGETAILLVSDGKETCDRNPCQLVKRLKTAGHRFTLHVVGFEVSAEAGSQLSCMAGAGGGDYYHAENAGEFKKAFQRIAEMVTTKDTIPRAAVNQPLQMENSLSLPKNLYRPGETMVVTFTAKGHYPKHAWVGILPSKIQHGSEWINDRYDISYEHLEKRVSGTITFKAPKVPGDYDIRMHDSDNKGNEVASISFIVR